MLFFYYFYLPLNEERLRLTFLIGSEKLLGWQPWYWEGLRKLGLSLNRKEAREYLLNEDRSLDHEREALYEFLFENHPELKLSAFSADELRQLLRAESRE
jgi:hypothetical protein